MLETRPGSTEVPPERRGAGTRSTARASLEPGALVLRHARRYQRVRRAVLAGSALTVLLAPLWHLARDRAAGSGLAGEGRWAGLAERLPLAGARPVALGAPWSFQLFGVEFLDPLAAWCATSASGR